MKKMYVILAVFVIGLLLFSCSVSLAAQQSMTVLQPKYNFEFSVYRTEDMPANWYKTYDDYYVSKGIDNNWIYGKQSPQGITATNILVGSVNPKDVKELEVKEQPPAPAYIPPESQETPDETTNVLIETGQAATFVAVSTEVAEVFPEEAANIDASNMVVNFSCENLDLDFSSFFFYTDERISFTLNLYQASLGIILHNNTSSPIVIDWNTVSYINENNISQRIVLDDVTWATRTNPIAVAHIPPSASISRSIIPADKLYLENGEGLYSENLIQWPIVGGIFTSARLDTNPKSKLYKNFCANYNGRKIGLYVPLQIGGETVAYTFFINFNFSAEPVPDATSAKTTVKSSGLTFDGLTVKSVELGSIAEKAGLKTGDAIIEINARPADEKILKDIDTRLAAGRSVIITYERYGTKDMATLR